MKIGIVGLGYVGTAVKTVFEKNYNIEVYDINKDVSSCESLDFLVQKTDIIFMCLPTPMNRDGSCNFDILEKSIKSINQIAKKSNQKKIIAIKSTIIPGTTESFIEKYNNISILFNPEFLTEANFINDFKNQNRIIIGGSDLEVNVLADVYSKPFPEIPILKTTPTIAEMIKYFTNTYLATKVSFANEMNLICNHLDIDYCKVLEFAKFDERLGDSHWNVPGPDGDYGFGGSCFPKDLNGLIYFCKKNNIQINTLMGVWKTNLNVRLDQDWKKLKGRAVIENEKNDK